MGTDSRFSRLRAGAININTAFRGARDLTERCDILAVNAQIAATHLGDIGQPFTVVVGHLKKMSSDLGELVKEVELVFANVALNVGKWMAEEKKASLYETGIQTINSEDVENSSEKEEMPNTPKGGGEDWKESLSAEVKKSGEMNKSFFRGIDEDAKALSRLLEHVKLMTQMQSQYLAMTAHVEAARLGENGGNLGSVADNITGLTGDLSKMQKSAEEQLYELQREIRGLSSYMKN